METEQKNGVEIAIVIADIYGLEDHRQLFERFSTKIGNTYKV